MVSCMPIKYCVKSGIENEPLAMVQKIRLQLLPLFVMCSDTHVDEYLAGL